MSAKPNRVRILRRRAELAGLQLWQRGNMFALGDDAGRTVARGGLSVIDDYLAEHYVPRRSGPRRQPAPAAWEALIEDYVDSLCAAGQRDETIRLRRATLKRIARGLGCAPTDVNPDRLLAWFGHQAHWAPETRRSYRSAACGFFRWAYQTRRVASQLGDVLPAVRQPKASPRPAPDYAYEAALGAADARVALMLRLAAEAGLRRAEVAQVHHRDLVDTPDGAVLRVHGKGGKARVIPINDSLADQLRRGAAGHTPGMPARGWLFPANFFGGHITPDCVGRLVTRALPDQWTMHSLRHRMASRAYRGTRNLLAVQKILGHESLATTERYLAVDDSECRAAMMAAVGGESW